MNGGGKPLVSVVVPAYNAEDTIRETIDSVLGQTLVDFELIVIDDGSTDATMKIVAGILDARVKGFSFKNAGPSSARNRGIEYASGKFIAFLDADDLWFPGKLAVQVEALRRNPDAALVYSWTDSIDESGAFLKKGHHVFPEDFAYEQLIVWNFLDNGSTPMVRHDALLEVGVFNEELRLAEDWDLWLRISYRYSIVCVPEVHVLYRVRQSSSSSNVLRMAEAGLKVLQSALDRLPNTSERACLERTAKANQYQYWAMRLVETSSGRRTGIEAAGYWWQYVTTTPDLLSHLNRILLIGSAILAILVLPPRQFKRLRQSLSRMRAVKTDHVGSE